ncbi:MAG: hypothetical protein WCJ18_00035 [Planctomycetota bacterium]
MAYPTSPAPRMPTASVRVVVLILVAAVVIGSFGTFLNARYYAGNQPFYDSCSYNTRVHGVMRTCRESGLPAALRRSCSPRDTVCLPYFAASFLGLATEPSRAIGTWIQVAELTVFCLSLLYFLTAIQGWSPGNAALAIAPLVLLRCLWKCNGGISDFRMDLGLMLGYWTTAIWYVIAARSGWRSHFIVLGIACGLTCLLRATAPLYIVFGLAPLACIDTFRTADRRRWLANLCVAVTTAGAVGLWFYLLNFKFLHYYYFVWNCDANARLPLRDSLQHVRFAFKHVGLATLLYAVAFRWLAFGPGSITAWDRPTLLSAVRAVAPRPALVWLALAPVGMLVLQGAGLNPFVSMPSTLGLALVALLPPQRSAEMIPPLSRRSMALLVAVLIPFATITGGYAIYEHRGPEPTTMPAHKELLRAMAEDAATSRKKHVTFSATCIAQLHTDSLMNVALFDLPEARTMADVTTVNGVALAPDMAFAAAAEADWKSVPGATDREKCDWLCGHAVAAVDYLIMPTEETCEFLTANLGHCVINRYVGTLRRQLLEAGTWECVVPEISNTSQERFSLYRNTTRLIP